MPTKALVLIPYISEYHHYKTCSPKEAGMRWFRSLLRLNRPVRRKVSVTRLHAGFRAFHEFERFPSEGEKFLLPYEVNGRQQSLLLRVTKVDWPRSLSGPYLLYCEFDLELSKEDEDFFAGRTFNQDGFFTQNILNETDRIIGKTCMNILQMSKFHDLVCAWNMSQVKGLDYWCKKKEIKAAA